jgi:hypothetical protein
MADEFDFLREAEAENEALRVLLKRALDDFMSTGIIGHSTEKCIREALEKKPVKSLYRVGVEAAIRHLRQCEQAETEAHYEYRQADADPEAKVAHEFGRAYSLAVSELEKWHGG